MQQHVGMIIDREKVGLTSGIQGWYNIEKLGQYNMTYIYI